LLPRRKVGTGLRRNETLKHERRHCEALRSNLIKDYYQIYTWCYFADKH